MIAPTFFTWFDKNLWLCPERCVFWEDEKALIVSDLHIGKTGHFRKSGIAVPQRVYTEDLQRLLTLILSFKAEQLIIVGDLSHSYNNRELELFQKWRHDFSLLAIHLVKGNHDILKESWYKQANIEVHHHQLAIGNFNFCHDFNNGVPAEHQPAYLFSGHFHPGVKVRGMGKQSLYFPCFHFTSTCCVLPAFSRFTGLAPIEREENDHVFAIVDNSILKLK